MKYGTQHCEVCSFQDWSSLGKRMYSSEEIDQANDYNRKRYSVLFEKWFPGLSTVELDWVYCNNCGFVIYTPRPDESDVDEKYRYLEILEQDTGRSPFPGQVARKRSLSILQYLRKRVKLSGVNEVLDYGGGDGSLMQAFREMGMSCFLVDYNKNCLPGIRKLADTVHRLSPESAFDLIICSHVMEHIAEPLKVILTLSQHLRTGGYLFIEVPLDIWERQSLPDDPVTHINYFTPNSLWNLLVLSGIQPLYSELTWCLNLSGEWSCCVRALAEHKITDSNNGQRILKRPDVNKYLNPKLWFKMRYYSTNSSVLIRAIKDIFCD